MSPPPPGRSGRFLVQVVWNADCARWAALSTATESGVPCGGGPPVSSWSSASKPMIVRPLSQHTLALAPPASLTAWRPGLTSPPMDIPRDYNAATWFVDRHVAEGRAARLAV